MVSPIKTPQEMLAEMSGIPHFAGGSQVGQFTKQIAEAIAKYKRLYGKAPSPEEVKGLEQYVTNLSKPTPSNIPTNPARLAATTPHPELLVDEAGYGYRAAQGPRGLTTPEQAQGYTIDPFGKSPENMTAREEAYKIGTRALKTKVGGEKFAELPTRVKVIEDRDPFLTQALTGRPPSGTRQKPFTVNVDDLHAQHASQEAKGIYGGSTGLNPGDYPAQSITPSADYFASMAAAKEEPYVWAIKRDLTEQLGRRPTEEEVNIALANMNPLGQDYTGMGSTVFGLKPAMPKGRPTKAQQEEIDAWRQLGIDSGEARSAVEATGSDLKSRYPSLQREVEWGPEPKMAAGGSTSPEQMRHLMLAYGKTPQKFAAGAAVRNVGVNAAMGADMLGQSAKQLGKQLKKGQYGSAANTGVDIASIVSPYFLVPSIYQAGRGMSNFATENLARNPEQRKQLNEMTSTPLGGALAGDTGLAAAIMGNRNMEAALDERNAEQIAEIEAQKEADAKAYREYLRQTSPLFKQNQPVEYVDFMKELGYK